jgi:hypothetical protein
MAYDQTKPQSTDTKSASQPVILENFLQIYNFVGQDHEQFNTPNAGKHKYVTYTRQGADPGTAATDIAVYSKVSDITAETGIFWQRQNNGNVIEMTAFEADGHNGYTMLPSGLKLNFGRGTISAGSDTGAVITFESEFSTDCYAISFALLGVAGSYDGADWHFYAAGLDETGFIPTRIRPGYHGSDISFSYIAIGD